MLQYGEYIFVVNVKIPCRKESVCTDVYVGIQWAAVVKHTSHLFPVIIQFSGISLNLTYTAIGLLVKNPVEMQTNGQTCYLSHYFDQNHNLSLTLTK